MGNQLGGNKNNGNTCFANALLVLLLSNRKVLRLLHGASCRETPPVKGSILYELILLAKSGMQYGESRPRRKHVTMSTAPLLSLLSEKCVENYSDGSIHDPLSLFNHVLEHCDDDAMRELFKAGWETAVVCECGALTKKHDPATSLQARFDCGTLDALDAKKHTTIASWEGCGGCKKRVTCASMINGPLYSGELVLVSVVSHVSDSMSVDLKVPAETVICGVRYVVQGVIQVYRSMHPGGVHHFKSYTRVLRGYRRGEFVYYDDATVTDKPSEDELINPGRVACILYEKECHDDVTTQRAAFEVLCASHERLCRCTLVQVAQKAMCHGERGLFEVGHGNGVLSVGGHCEAGPGPS